MARENSFFLETYNLRATNRDEKTKKNTEFISEILHFSDLGSTNSVAKRMILKENKQGFVIISKTQTSGYGQRGNFWESPPGGLWCSIALKPVINPKNINLIPILCALSVAKALKLYNISNFMKIFCKIVIKRMMFLSRN